jgi:hypothetical protein
MYDFLFELTEYSENEGEMILVECHSLSEAKRILIQNDFSLEEVRFIERMETWEGELLGLDTY